MLPFLWIVCSSLLVDERVIDVNGIKVQYIINNVLNKVIIGNTDRMLPCIDENETGNITIPEKIENMEPIEIRERAFAYTHINGITLPPSITTIKESCFAFTPCINFVNLSLTKITYIPPFAFQNSSIKHVYLPRCIRSIYERAFDFSCIETINISTIESISAYAFNGCKFLKQVNAESASVLARGVFLNCENLHTITLSPNLYTIPRECFKGAGIVNITWPKNLDFIDEKAFYGCNKLKAFKLPPKLQGIEKKAFANCLSLEQVNLRRLSFIKLPAGLFKNCISIVEVKFPPYLETIEEKVFFGCGFENLAIPKSILTAHKECFALCADLKQVDMSECQLKIIPDGMFRMCSSLENITFSQNTFKISDRAFEMCVSLGRLNLQDCYISTICDYAFHSCSDLTHVELPQRITKISQGAFHSTSIQSIKFAQPVYYIGKECFYSCHRLKKVDLRLARITQLPSDIFADCIALKDIYLPENITSIGARALAYTAISIIKLPSSVVKLGSRVFEGSKLEEIDLSKTNVQKLKGTFRNCQLLEKFEPPPCLRYIEDSPFFGTRLSFVIPSTVTDFGENAFDSSLFTGGIINENVSTILPYAFANCRKLKSIDLSFTGVTKINSGTFYNTPLKTIRWPLGLVSVGERFLENTSMYEVKLPETLEVIEEGAFIGCNSVIIDLSKCNNLVSIPKNAFRDLTRLENVRLPDTPVFKLISKCAFMGSGITILFVPDSLQTIEISAFANCHSLTKLDLSHTKLTNLSYGVFFNSSLTSIQLPPSIVTIGGWAFAMSDLTEFIGWGNLDNIDPFAFYWCHRLSNLDLINANIKVIMDHTFTGCKRLRTAYIGSPITTIEKCAFANCSWLEYINLNKTSVSILKEGVFANCSRLTELELGLYTVELGSYCFYNSSIQSFNFSSMVTTIGAHCFESCKKLSSIDFIKSHIEVVPRSAFQDCVSLTSINLSPYMKEFGHQAFFNVNIVAIKVPTFIKKLGRNCFANCRNLKEVDLSRMSLKGIPYGLFANCTQIHTMKLPTSIEYLDCLPELLFIKECPVYDNFWEGRLRINNDDDDFETIGYTVDVNHEHIPMPGTFLNNTEVELISLQNSKLNATEMYMFYGCIKLKVILLPPSIRHIGYATFAKSGMENIKLEGNVTEISAFAFHGCDGLEIIELEETQITKLSPFVLSFLPKLKNLKLPPTIERICEGAFFNTTLPNFVFTRSMKYIEKSAFALTDVESLDMSETDIEEIPDFAFYKCQASVINMPPKLKRIGKKGLAMTNIESFNSPETLEEIGFFALAGNDKLKKVNLSESKVKRLPYCSFASNHALNEVVLPNNLLDIDDTAFFDCPSLKEVYFYGCTEISVSGIFPSGTKVYVLENYRGKTFCGIRVEMYYKPYLEDFIETHKCSLKQTYVHYSDGPSLFKDQKDPLLLSYFEKE